MFECLKKKNTSVVGVPQPPSHPSNDSTPILIDPNRADRENLWEKYAYTNTSAFEGSGINQVTDNFDGQGISLGGLQWCVLQGSLQAKILIPYFSQNEPKNETEKILLEISKVSNSAGLALCKKHFLSGTKLLPTVYYELQKFIVGAEKYQLMAAEELFNKAWELCKSSGLTSLKSFCYFFDVCVQNGSMDGVPKPKVDRERYREFIRDEGGVNRTTWQSIPIASDETIILCLWIDDRAKQNKWRSDVIARKCSIAHGVGTVHDTKYTFPEFNQSL